MRINQRMVWGVIIFLFCFRATAQEVIRSAEILDGKGKLLEKVKTRIQRSSAQTSFEHLYLGSRYRDPENNKPVWIDSDQLIVEDDDTQLLMESTIKKVRKKVTLFGSDLVQALSKEPAENQIIVRYHDNQTLIPFNSDPYLGTVRFDLKPDLTAWTDTLPSFRFRGFFINTYSGMKKLSSSTVQLNFSSQFVAGPVNKEEYKSIYLPNGGVQFQSYMIKCLARGVFVVDTDHQIILSGQYTFEATEVDMLELEPGKYTEIPNENKMKVKISNEVKD